MSDPRRAWLVIAVVAAFAGGCGTSKWNPRHWGSVDTEVPSIDLIAVSPIREVPPRLEKGERPVLETHAGRAITGQIYGFLAGQTRFRFVPDLTVEATAARIGIQDEIEAAKALAAETGADAVLFGNVFRFQERVGTRFAATHPASVSFDLALYSVPAGDVVWRRRFDETQVPLSSNLFNAWMFWRAGPHWFTVRELAGLGVDRLLKTLPE